MTVLNERKVAEIQEYILEDKRVTVENVAEHFGISYGTAQDIMSNKLGMRRVSARWVPRLLLPEQMGVRVKMCNEYCRQYNDEGDTFLNRVVTCDETWIHFFEPESKHQSSVWKHPSSPSPTKALISKSAGKVMAIVGWLLVGCFGFNGPLRQYFSLYRAVSQREGEREEKRIDESKNVQTTPTRTYYKRNRPLPYGHPS